jgi:hypothetical protein
MQTPESDRAEYEAFRAAVRRHGQTAMARSLRVSPAFVSELINEKRKMKGGHIRRMGEVLKSNAYQIDAVNRHCARLAGYNV